MNLCHLYFKTTSSKHVDAMLKSFDESVSLDIDEVDKLDNYDIYLIELYDADKNMSAILKKIFKQKSNSFISFVIPKKYNLLLFQLAFLVGAKSIITQNQDVEKSILKIKADKKAHDEENYALLAGKADMKVQNFMIYENDFLMYVSAELLKLFECDDIDMFEDVISRMNIKSLLKNDIIIKKSITKSLKKLNYIFKSTTVAKINKIITIEVDGSNKDDIDENQLLISSRVSFVKLLKEKIEKRELTNNQLSAITLSIQNMKKLQEELTVVDLEMFFNKLLPFVSRALKTNILFTQIDIDFYVILFEGTDFEEISDITDNFHIKVVKYIEAQKFRAVVDIFAFDLSPFDFSEILSTLNSIKIKKFTHEQKYSDSIRYSSHTENVINEKSLLDDAYEEDEELKLLNVYKGLVINTPSKIVKTTKENIYINFEQIQGVVLSLDKETVLQADSFSQDIYAKVKQINLKSRMAILEKFKFLKTNATERQYARVITARVIPVTINMKGSSLNGNILDISIKSIAMQVKATQRAKAERLMDVVLTFNVPDAKADFGYTQINLEAKVIAITSKDEEGNYKVICELDENTQDLPSLSKYVYERQKELIIELKKTSKLN
ncbi:MAG: PilZ domain-containing protein [Campylobacterota bacterium]|nr:PilZ domain-containing protein [Campylobacterota bacterium]